MKHEVIKLDSIKLASVNNKYITGKFILNPTYKQLKDVLILSCKKIKLNPPYRVDIYIEAYLDIDNPIKVILDSLENVISNDRDILELSVKKKKIKRGSMNKLVVWVEELKL